MFAASVATVPAHALATRRRRDARPVSEKGTSPRRVIARASSDETPRASPAEITRRAVLSTAAGLAAGVSANDEPPASRGVVLPGSRFPFDQVASAADLPSVPRASSRGAGN